MGKRILTPFRKKYLNFRVAEKRRELKLQALEYKGGSCANCGYNKCPAAMVFHHPDPSEKDFGISGGGNIKSFEKMKPELDKCILLCGNCHSEVHYAEDQLVVESKRKEIEEEKRSYKKHSQIA